MVYSEQASPKKAKNRFVVTRAEGSGQDGVKAELLFKISLTFNTKLTSRRRILAYEMLQEFSAIT